MTLPEALRQACERAEAETVEGPVRTWFQRFRLAARDRWRPTRDERQRAMLAASNYIARHWGEHGMLPRQAKVLDRVRGEVSADPFTVLWIVVMVARLLAELRKWSER